jgi:hypothetical protein
VDQMTEQPGLNTGKEWSKKDLFSLRNRIEHGRTVADVATFLMRTEAPREGSRAWAHASYLRLADCSRTRPVLIFSQCDRPSEKPSLPTLV